MAAERGGGRGRGRRRVKRGVWEER